MAAIDLDEKLSHQLMEDAFKEMSELDNLPFDGAMEADWKLLTEKCTEAKKAMKISTSDSESSGYLTDLQNFDFGKKSIQKQNS